ncbi:MAG: hypothetical protein LUC88_10325 [Prevotella sp.]|nr:hypothetical protein [Prevotella sp.]
MKEISKQSLMKIHDVIHGQSYVNIKARLNNLLPKEYSSAFANIHLAGTNAAWYGEDSIEYLPYSSASEVEKEEIAIWLEQCKNEVCETLAREMAYVHLLFIIPSQEEIFWYRDENGNIHVTLAQWGFEPRSTGKKVDVIGMLLSVPRNLSQQKVNIHIDYSDNLPAGDTPFILHLFNNTKECKTDVKGDFYLGTLFQNKSFDIENMDGSNHFDFTVVKDGTYSAVFDLNTKYTIIIEYKDGECIPDYTFKVDGVDVRTNEDGKYENELKLLPNTTIDVEADNSKTTYTLKRSPEDNVFHIQIDKPIIDEPVITKEPDIKEKPIQQPEPKYVYLKVLDFDGKPLPDMPLAIKCKAGETISTQTDGQGVAKIDKSLLDEKKKYRVVFKITPEYRKNLNKNKDSNEK